MSKARQTITRESGGPPGKRGAANREQRKATITHPMGAEAMEIARNLKGQTLEGLKTLGSQCIISSMVNYGILAQIYMEAVSRDKRGWFIETFPCLNPEHLEKIAEKVLHPGFYGATATLLRKIIGLSLIDQARIIDGQVTVILDGEGSSAEVPLKKERLLDPQVAERVIKQEPRPDGRGYQARLATQEEQRKVLEEQRRRTEEQKQKRADKAQAEQQTTKANGSFQRSYAFDGKCILFNCTKGWMRISLETALLGARDCLRNLGTGDARKRKDYVDLLDEIIIGQRTI